MRPCLSKISACCAGVVLTLAAHTVSAADLTIFAAASLKEAVDEASLAYMRQSGDNVKTSFGASSALARQIENGAPANIFISADLDWMDYLDKQNLIQKDTRKDLVGNRLVVAAPADVDIKLIIKPGFDLAGALHGGKLAMADPSGVPAGKYGKTALEKLGVWASVEKSVARAENVRAALLLVSRHEAPLGIVYATDVIADPGVKVVGVFPPETHPAIVYPIAVTSENRAPAARRLLEFLTSAAAKPIFEKHGFTVGAE